MRSPVVALGLLLLATCGGRTGLSDLERAGAGGSAGGDDAALGADGAGVDAAHADGAPDAAARDATSGGCPGGAAALVYLVSEKRELYSFDPTVARFRDIGRIDCPTPLRAYSMAVDRAGTAYVLLHDPTANVPQGQLYRVDTSTAHCSAIPAYVPGQLGFGVFGMGYATNGAGPAETLYVIGEGFLASTPALGTLDTSTFKLGVIGQNPRPLEGAQLTGTGDGRLYSFYFYRFYFCAAGEPPYLGRIDETTGLVQGETQLTGVDVNQCTFAVASWGGDFYFFTAPWGGPTTATRYDPTTQAYTPVGTLDAVIVGAGVSTCAPQ